MNTFTEMVEVLQSAQVATDDAWHARARAVLAQVYKDTVANAPTSTTVSFDSRP